MIEAVFGTIVGAAALITLVLTALYRHAPQSLRRRHGRGRRPTA